jgi:ferredoxin
MKRKIIEIEESKCNGCGNCIPNCPEGALQIIDGKARLISDLFCDGLGACVGECPTGALKVVEREAEPYDERRAMENIIPKGHNTIVAHLKHLKDHGENELFKQAMDVLREQNIHIDISEIVPAAKHSGHHHGHGGCPGGMAKVFERHETTTSAAGNVPSELRQWPIQLMLVNPDAAFFDNADLLVCADCVPFAFGDFHRKLLKSKVVITFCPKLDQTIDTYIEKLTHIFKTKNVKSVTVARMEVPCCGGTEHIVRQALKNADSEDKIKTHVISLDGREINN